MEQSLVITEIYGSIQGESSYAGWPCTFVRLTGCPLRCRWCDTAYGFEGGERIAFGELLQRVKAIGLPLVEITGGEPLAQRETGAFIAELIRAGYKVLIETGGSEPIQDLHQDCHIIMDIKCPGSGMAERNLWANLDHLKASDEVKFVLAGREDYEWARTIIKEHHLEDRVTPLLSCAWGHLKPANLVSWMVEDKLRCRLNLQQHKYIWSPRAKGV